MGPHLRVSERWASLERPLRNLDSLTMPWKMKIVISERERECEREHERKREREHEHEREWTSWIHLIPWDHI